MSRIGKKPITIPDGVKVSINQETREISAQGPQGSLKRNFHPLIVVEQKDKELKVKLKEGHQEKQSLLGTERSLLHNIILGVTKAFSRTLEILGLGYKAVVKGRTLVLNLGHSHAIDFPIPLGLEIKVEKNQIIISGANKEMVGLVAAKIRKLRLPEPYKGTGVKYLGEVIHRKAGKTTSAA